MIEFEEDPDPRERVAEALRPRRRCATAIPPIRSMFDDLSDESWDEDFLWRCQRDWLAHLCRLMGAPVSGKVEQVITRLLAVRAVHQKLQPFNFGQHAAVAERFNREEIRWMCREARLPRSLNKRTMAWLLLNWRAATKMAGDDFFEHLKAGTLAAWTNPRQRLAPLVRRLFAIIERDRNNMSREVSKFCHPAGFLGSLPFSGEPFGTLGGGEEICSLKSAARKNSPSRRIPGF